MMYLLIVPRKVFTYIRLQVFFSLMFFSLLIFFYANQREHYRDDETDGIFNITLQHLQEGCMLRKKKYNKNYSQNDTVVVLIAGMLQCLSVLLLMMMMVVVVDDTNERRQHILFPVTSSEDIAYSLVGYSSAFKLILFPSQICLSFVWIFILICIIFC